MTDQLVWGVLGVVLLVLVVGGLFVRYELRWHQEQIDSHERMLDDCLVSLSCLVGVGEIQARRERRREPLPASSGWSEPLEKDPT